MYSGNSNSNERNWDFYFTINRKIKLKYIKHLNIRVENIEGQLNHFCLDNDFMNMTQKANTTKVKRNKMGLHQTKEFL